MGLFRALPSLLVKKICSIPKRIAGFYTNHFKVKEVNKEPLPRKIEKKVFDEEAAQMTLARYQKRKKR
jgi:hypothetical protein